MTALYNENDPYAAQWLRNLSEAGHIAEGHVDERSIRDLTAADLSGVTQAHFFAGIGGWSYALRLAGWPDDEPVWTGSCPCQPFSGAGRRKGFDDERHLWPAWFALIRECRPPVVFGEQVANPGGLVWLDLVLADLEDAGYACAAADLCAASVGAPHIRQRLFFVAVAEGGERGNRSEARIAKRWERQRPQHGISVGDAERTRLEGRASERGDDEPKCAPTERAGGDARGLGLAGRERREGIGVRLLGRGSRAAGAQADGAGATRLVGPHGPTGGAWFPADWLFCRDGKYRPVEPGTFPLAYGVPARVGKLRAYGNAIVPQVAAVFVRAAMEAMAAPLPRQPD